MPADPRKRMAPEDSIHELLIQAEADAQTDPRSGVRFPFFRLVSIELDGRSYSGFTRDICVSSIGLLHNVELPLCEVAVVIPIATDKKCKVHLRIERCEPCGEGWYISGGRFIGVAPAAELDDELLDVLLSARK